MVELRRNDWELAMVNGARRVYPELNQAVEFGEGFISGNISDVFSICFLSPLWGCQAWV
jgi:hypothetical protein